MDGSEFGGTPIRAFSLIEFGLDCGASIILFRPSNLLRSSKISSVRRPSPGRPRHVRFSRCAYLDPRSIVCMAGRTDGRGASIKAALHCVRTSIAFSFVPNVRACMATLLRPPPSGTVRTLETRLAGGLPNDPRRRKISGGKKFCPLPTYPISTYGRNLATHLENETC